MPAMLEDPDAPKIYRVSGEAPRPHGAETLSSQLTTIQAKHVTLRDRQTAATVIPFASRHYVPQSLLSYLCDQFNREVEGGDTFSITSIMTVDKFSKYWFQNFAAIMLLGHVDKDETVPAEGAKVALRERDWTRQCLGSFYIKPNYPGRSSHVCNAGFLVTDASRNRGAGRLMGEAYIEWAPRLGYTYSVFNLVYETNVASCKIWDALGFKRIGRVKGAGDLKSYPNRLVDAIIYGRDLSMDEADKISGASSAVELGNEVSNDRFDKIKYYLRYGEYPKGSNRAEKSRLRAASTHYKLMDDKLMLKGKEVVSDPKDQTEIVQRIHDEMEHAGINKTTTATAEKYHWGRIKETVGEVVRRCPECRENGKSTTVLRASTMTTTIITNTTTAAAAAAATAATMKTARSTIPSTTTGHSTTMLHAYQPRHAALHSTKTSKILPSTSACQRPQGSPHHTPPPPAAVYPTASLSSIAPSRTIHSQPVSSHEEHHGLHHPLHFDEGGQPPQPSTPSHPHPHVHPHGSALLPHLSQAPPQTSLLSSPATTTINLYAQPLNPAQHLLPSSHHHHNDRHTRNAFAFRSNEHQEDGPVSPSAISSTMCGTIDSMDVQNGGEDEDNGMVVATMVNVEGMSQSPHLGTYPEPEDADAVVDTFQALLDAAQQGRGGNSSGGAATGSGGVGGSSNGGSGGNIVVPDGSRSGGIVADPSCGGGMATQGGHCVHPVPGHHHHHQHHHRVVHEDVDEGENHDRQTHEAVERDLDMLIEHDEQDEQQRLGGTEMDTDEPGPLGVSTSDSGKEYSIEKECSKGDGPGPMFDIRFGVAR